MSIRDLLQTTRDITLPQRTEVWDLSSDETGKVFNALSSDTARNLLELLYDEPRTASEIADELDMSLQNVGYHLEKLCDAELIEIAETEYSRTGKEMKIYAPTTNAVVLLSTPSTGQRIRSTLHQVFSWILLLGIVAAIYRAVLVERIVGVPDIDIGIGSDDEAEISDDDDVADEPVDDAEDPLVATDDAPDPSEDTEMYERREEEEFDQVIDPGDMVETVNPLEHLPLLLDPGVAFFLGASIAVLLIVGFQWWRH